MKTDTTEYRNRPKPQPVDEALLQQQKGKKEDPKKKVERLQK